MFDKNAAILAYSAAFGNNLKRLEDYCREVGFEGDVVSLADSIQQIQDQVFDQVWQQSEDRRPLSEEEITAILRRHVAEHEPWINDAGIAGLLQWVAWMSWHEGCLAIPHRIPDPKPWWQFW